MLNDTKIKRIIRAVCTLLVVCIICTGAVYDAVGIKVTVTVRNDFDGYENTFNARSVTASLDDLFKDNDIQIGVFDKVNLDESHVLQDGDSVVIRRGVGIMIDCDGELISTSSTHRTVGESLVENGYFIGESDYTVPSLESEVTDGMKITVVRVNENTEVRDNIIAFETVYKDDPTLYKGDSKVAQEGVNGVERITEKVIFENGTEVSRTELSRELVTEKVDKIVLNGTKQRPVSTPKAAAAKTKSSSPVKSAKKSNESIDGYKRVITMTATAYSAFGSGGGYGKTASGMTAGHGVAAVDPSVIPLGTKLYVEGYGYAVAADTGGAIKGNKIDLCFEQSNSELMAFGRKTVTVYILS